MGRAGIRRRKGITRRRLPPPAAAVDENDRVPPHIMWPDRGSGFEADPSSPAGSSQREWWFLTGLAQGRRGRIPRDVVVVAAWVGVGLFAAAYVVRLVF